MNFQYWTVVGLQGFQLLGYVAQRNPRVQPSAIPILLISLTLIAISGYIDFSHNRNNQGNSHILNLLAIQISAAIAVIGATLLGAYIGDH